MANQMIALGVRGPQLPDLGRAMSQYGSLMNTMAQQRASQRQAEQSAQSMDIARRQEARAVAAHDIEQAGRQIDYYTTLAGQTMNRAGYERLLSRLDTDAPEIAAQFRTNLPPENFDRSALLQMVGSISDNFKANFGPLETQVVQADDGTFMVARTGGVQEPGVFELQEYALRPSGAAAPAAGARAPQQPMSFEETFSDLRSDALTPEQAAPILGNAARTGTINQSDADRLRSSLPPQGRPRVDEFIRQRGIEVTPINFVPGSSGQPTVEPLTMETAPQIIQAAVQNRAIDESHVQQLRQMVGPENEQALAQWMQQNGVRITPAGQPAMQSAVYRPGQDATAEMTQVQSMDNYVPTGRAARGRDMRIGQAPAESVPQAAERAGATSAASREPIPEAATRARETTLAEREAEAATAYQRERNTRQAQADVDFMQQYPGAASTVRNNLSILNRMIGDARVAEGRVTVPRGGRRPHAGFEGVVGVGIPGMRFVPGTSAADFDALFNQVTGAAFLEAFETLKGGGSITEREGQVATQAITRLSRNISEVEFIEAANELRDIMQRGLERAEARAARIEGRPAPAANAAPRQQPQRRTRGGATVSNWPGSR